MSSPALGRRSAQTSQTETCLKNQNTHLFPHAEASFTISPPFLSTCQHFLPLVQLPPHQHHWCFREERVCEGLLGAPLSFSSLAEPQLGCVSSQGLCSSLSSDQLPPVPPVLRKGEKLFPSIYCLWNDLSDCSLPLLPVGLTGLSYLLPFQQSLQIVIQCTG